MIDQGVDIPPHVRIELLVKAALGHLEIRSRDTEAVKLTTARYYTPSGRSIHKEHVRDDEPVVADLGDDADDPHASLNESM